MKRCEGIRSPRPGIYRPGVGGYWGGQCSRTATYTNGTNYYCTQHAKNPATPLRKADGKIMEGFKPINTEVKA